MATERRYMYYPKSLLSQSCLSFLLLITATLIDTALGIQRIVEHPTDQSVIVDNSVILHCKVADRVGTVQWTRNKFGLGNDRSLSAYPRYSVIGSQVNGEYNLWIQNASLLDDGVYECQISHTATQRGVRSNPAKVSVLLPPREPTIDSSPVITVTEGIDYNITCRSYDGKPAPNITWWINGQLQNKRSYEIVTTQSDGKREDIVGLMTIKPSKQDHGKEFECRAINPALTSYLKTTAKLHVLYKPQVTLSVSPPTEVTENTVMQFKCQADANPRVTSWKWYRNGNILSESSQLLEITSRQNYHGQTIKCEAINTVGKTTKSYKLNIEYSPRFVKEPLNVDADLGGRATLNCVVDGNPVPRVIWKKGSQEFPISKPTLTFSRALTEADFGTYVCVASSNLGSVERQVQLLKNGKPKVTGDLRQYAAEGDDAVIECESDSVPKPKEILWSRGSSKIATTGSSRFSTKESDLVKGRKSILTIKNIHAADYGDYNCTVINNYGMDSAIIKLIQKVASASTSDTRDAVPLAYVLAGVFGGLGVIVIIVVILIIYNRKKVKDEDSTADTNSTDSANKKNLENVRMEFRSTGSEYPGPQEPWRGDYLANHIRADAEYDQLGNIIPYQHTKQDGRPPVNGYGGHYDYQDGNMYDVDRRSSDRLPTYDSKGIHPRSYDSGFEPDVYPKQYGRPPPSSEFTNDIYGPPPTVTTGRLSTNV